MKIAVTGGSGFIGTALVPHLRQRGHTVLTLVRRPPTTTDEVQWDPASGLLDAGSLTGVEAAVHLSGAGVGDARWTASYRRTILDSRVDSTALIARTLADLGGVYSLAVASGIDFYQASPEPTGEDGPAGRGFLADVCRAWEGAADPARSAGIAVSHLRTGLVLAPTGGVFGKLARLVKLGLGGPLGSGQQWWSWIALPDQVAAITLLLERSVSGPVNFVSPEPVRQADFMRALGRAAGRPAVLPAPALALKLALGDFAETILADRRIIPTKLVEHGFSFEYPKLDSVADWLLKS